MKKMLYLSHVPWGWIKQRPHFIAEKLSNDYEVHVYPLESIRNKQHTTNLGHNFILKKLLLPLHIKGFSLNAIGTLLYSLIFRTQIHGFNDYQYVWITNIWFYRYIKRFIKPNQILIYDCMDDDLEFPLNKRSTKIQNTIRRLEKELLSRANIILFSSRYLSDKVIGRSNLLMDRDKISVINNAVELPATSQPTNNPEVEKTLKYIRELSNPIIYIGTIAEWLDFKLLENTLKNNPDLNFVLIGPTEVEIPDIRRLHYLGRIQRDYIFDIMNEAKALMMPFIVNELIKSVNPVKLYEYIYSGKPIFVPEYDEMRQFSPYVYSYHNENEFMDLTNMLSTRQLQEKYRREEGERFSELNNWESRCNQILKLINQC